MTYVDLSILMSSSTMPIVAVNLPNNRCRRAGPRLQFHHNFGEEDSVVKASVLKERQIRATNCNALWLSFSKIG